MIPNYGDVQRSLTINWPGKPHRQFPRRQDYIDYLKTNGLISKSRGFTSNPQLVLDIQLDWHMRGQNGCRFAQFLSGSPPEHDWKHVVITENPQELLSNETLEMLDHHVTEAIADDNSRAISMLFSECTTVRTLVSLLQKIGELPDWGLTAAEHPDNRAFVLVQLRKSITLGGVLSLALGFGPFDFLPLTRRSPVTEIAMVAKPKVFPQRISKLDDDPITTHLADMPVPRIPDPLYKKLWKGTAQNKKNILENYKDRAAKARVTFCLPADAWNHL